MSNSSGFSAKNIRFNPNQMAATLGNNPAFQQFVAPPVATTTPPLSTPATSTAAGTPASTSSSAQSQSATSVQPQSQPTSSPSSHVEPSKTVTNLPASASSSTTSVAIPAKSQQTAQPSSKTPGKFYPPPAQTFDVDKCKGHRFVTLDGLQYQTRPAYDDIAGTFKWEACGDQVDECIRYIRDECADRRVFLLTSGGLGAQVVPKIHDLPQLYAVYIHCADVDSHRKWSKDFYKVRVVCFDDTKDLLPQFAVDMAQSLVDWGDGLVAKGEKAKAKAKYQLALDKLNNHCRNHDLDMDITIQKKINHCE